MNTQADWFSASRAAGDALTEFDPFAMPGHADTDFDSYAPYRM